jgi:hypothetical protein
VKADILVNSDVFRTTVTNGTKKSVFIVGLKMFIGFHRSAGYWLIGSTGDRHRCIPSGGDDVAAAGFF